MKVTIEEFRDSLMMNGHVWDDKLDKYLEKN